MYAGLREIEQAWATPHREQVIQEVWPTLRTETVDYGVMEGARQVAVIPAEGVGWSDVGSWESLFEILTPDEDGNLHFGGKHISLDSAGVLVYANDLVGSEVERLIVTIGVHDLIVVDTGDVMLICSREQAQRVREVVKQLRDRGEEQYL